MRLLTTLAAIAAAAALCACQTLHPRDLAPHDPRIVGTWMAIGDDGYDLQDRLDRGETTYFADGTTCGYDLDVDADGKTQLVVFRDKWEVKDGQLLNTMQRGNGEYMEPGRVITDDVISVDARELRLHSVEEPATRQYSRYRLPVDQGDQLCKLFDAVMAQSGGATAPP